MLIAYNANFNRRFATYEPYRKYPSDYEALSRTHYNFTSNKGQTLTGYLYSSTKTGTADHPEKAKAILVFVHGFGIGGHSSHMDIVNFFAQKNFLVFAYDATGNDESEGLGKKNAVGGMPQGVIDLDYAISFIEESGNFPKLPLVLCGHSWGGYSVVNVLNYHPEVKAVAEIAGFESSGRMFVAGGKKIAGPAIYTFMPFFYVHEFIKYGKYNFSTGIKGINSSAAKVLIIHGMQDKTVPVAYGYFAYYKAFKDNPRVTFMPYYDMDHTDILRSKEALAYIDKLDKHYDRWCRTLNYNYRAKENKERFEKEKIQFLKKNMDHKCWSHSQNNELLTKIADFYDASL